MGVLHGWSRWESNPAYRYAISYAGRLFPPKKIVSLATDTPVSKFRGGPETNSYPEDMGSTNVPMRDHVDPADPQSAGVQSAIANILTTYLEG